MKRLMRIIAFTLLFSVFALPVFSVQAAGKPKVIYDARIHEFKLENVKDRDLFVDFKNLMPGDKITTPITVEVKHAKKPVTIYLDSEKDEIPEALNRVVVRVAMDEDIVSEATIGEMLNEGNRIEIGRFEKSGSKVVDVTLIVPEELGNEIADLEQKVHWEWIAEDEGDLYSSDDPVKTGDEAPVMLLLVMFVVSGAVLTLKMFRRAK